MVFAPIQNLSQVFDGYQQATVGLQRIKDLLSAADIDARRRRPGAGAGRRGHRPDRAADVRFGYATGSELSGGEAAAAGEAIRGVSFTVAPGETVALVGQTGAGKSTIVKLIARFYDVTGGAVLIDGADVRTFDLTEYRQRLGVVPQEAYLFSGTVARGDRVRPAVRERRRGRGGGPGGGRAPDDRGAAGRVLRTRSGSAGGTSRRGSGSSSRWPGPSWSTRTSCFSTRRPRRWTWRPRRPCTGRHGRARRRGGPRSSSRTGSPRRPGRTASSYMDHGQIAQVGSHDELLRRRRRLRQPVGRLHRRHGVRRALLTVRTALASVARCVRSSGCEMSFTT